MDYAFVDKDDENLLERTEITVLNAKDDRSGALRPIPVPQKGIDREEYSTRMVMKFLRWLGYSDIILRTDGEHSIVKIADHVALHRGPGTETSPEKTQIGDSQSNGRIENANRMVECQTRTNLAGLSSKLGQRVAGDWDISRGPASMPAP